MKRYLSFISFSLLPLGCLPGAGGPADAGSDAPADTAADAGPCLPCAALLSQSPKPGDIALLCPSSRGLWKTLHDRCACDTEPQPPPGSGICVGPCTFMANAGHSWCSDLTQDPTCLACLAAAPVGCSGERAACLADTGGDQ